MQQFDLNPNTLEKYIQNKNITVDQYNKIIDQNKHHFDALLNIVIKSGQTMEGGLFYYHQSSTRITDDVNKQINLYVLGSISNNILEIGFNAGHSALLLLLSNKDNKICCFDICEHAYTKECFEYLSSQFPSRLELYEGDSNKTLLEYHNNNKDKKFDLCHIDGCHYTHVANIDYFHTRMMCQKYTIIVFDDTNIPGLQMLWNGYIRDCHMKEITLNKITVHQHSIGICL